MLAASLVLTGCGAGETMQHSSPNVTNTPEKKLKMNSRSLMTLRLDTAPIQDIGATRHGTRSIFPITGGSFEGDRLRGKDLAGGDDWMIARGDGVRELDLRITLETDDGALIYMTFTGVRHGAATDAGGEYFRTPPRFETAAPKYLLLNKLLAIRTDGPVHLIEEIL
jgi:hypothetical protein